METVQDVTPEARNLPPVNHLGGTGPRLRILASHAADADDALVGPPDEDEAHLQQQLDLGLDGALLAVVEELGAVAALEEEGFAGGDVPQVGLEALDLVGMDDGGHARELADGAGELAGVGVGGRLLDGLGAPG